MRAAPAYSKPTAAAQRKRGPRPRPRPRSGRPLEAADAPHDAARRRFVWYVFSDGVLICRNRMPITDGVLSPNEITVTPARAKLGLHRMSNAVRATIAPGSVSSSGPGAFSATTSSDLGVEVHHACWAEGGEPAMSALIEAVHAMQQAATRNTTRKTELEGTDTEF